MSDLLFLSILISRGCTFGVGENPYNSDQLSPEENLPCEQCMPGREVRHPMTSCQRTDSSKVRAIKKQDPVNQSGNEESTVW